MTRRIIQFGTSRFLQAHVDLFVHESRAAGHDIGPISVIKTAPGAMRASRTHCDCPAASRFASAAIAMVKS
jgi:tagaturonate reductase